ncbi:MAG: glutamine synthetase family protein [Rhodovibrionaceae bacterium]
MPDASASLPPEVADFRKRHPEIESVDAIYPDLSGVTRGKRYPVGQLDKIFTSGLNFPGSVFLLAANGESMDPEGFGFSDGDPDEIAKPVPGTLRPVAWAPRPLGQVLLSFETLEGAPYRFEPRNLLRGVLARFAELKLRPVVAFELEFYLIDRERTAQREPQPPISPLTGERDHATQVYGMNELDAFDPFLDDVHRACALQGIETGAISAEYAPGQFEINLHHSDDPLRAADDCALFKRAVKGCARKHGYQATFMAKPYMDQAGSGLHLHCSLLDESGGNAFAKGEDGGRDDIGPLLRHALGGTMEGLPESMAFLAPNPNSFRRFRPNLFVPLRRSWGHENRSVALRIPTGGPESRRIEHRVAGADANPYLALASFLASLHHGIDKRTDCGPAFEGNAGETPDGEMPLRPRRALDRLRRGEILKEYLGEEYLRTYATCKEAEYDAFEDRASPAEYEWYLQSE